MSLIANVGSGAAAGSAFGPVGTAVGAGVALLGSGLKALAGSNAAKKKNKILGQGIQEQAGFASEGARDVNNTVTALGQSRPDIAGSRGQFIGALRGGPQVGGLPTASRAFRTDSTAAAAANAGYGESMADLFARIRAPQTQMVQDSNMVGRLSTDLGSVSRRAASADFINKLKAGQVTENPWLKLGGNIASGVGKYGMSGGFGGSGLSDYNISGVAANGGYKYP